MAVTVTDTRLVLNEADSATGWTIGGGGTFGTTTFVEEAGAIISTLNIATGQIFFTTTARDISNELIYIWGNNFALQDLWTSANPPMGIYLGDGADAVTFKMSGRDRKVFAHLVGQLVDWECMVLDGSQASTMNTNGFTTIRAGTFAGLNLAAITQFGVDFTTLSKGLGGGVNVAVDIIRIGNNGLTITGGTTSDRGRFSEIVDEDKSTLTLKAHGIIREYTTGLYGVQGGLTLGDGGTTVSWFDDSNVTVAFEARDISNDKYFLATSGSATGETHIYFDNVTVTTAGPHVRLDFDRPFVDNLEITNTAFRNLQGNARFATASQHIVNNVTFEAQNTIYPGTVQFTNNAISNTAASQSAMIVGSGSFTNISDIVFTRGVTATHAIELAGDIPSAITFDNIQFFGYHTGSLGTNLTPASGETSASVFNNSGKEVTISIVGGSTPSVRNGTGATTIVNNNVSITVTGLRDGTEVRVYNTGTTTELAGIETATDGTIDDRSFTFSIAALTEVDIVIISLVYENERIEGYIVPNTDSSIPVQQRLDRNYLNPPGP